MAAASAQKSDRKLLTDSKLNKQLAQLQHLRQLSFTRDAEKGDSCRSSLMASGKLSTSGDQVAAEEALITHNHSHLHSQPARPRGLIKKLGSLLSYPRKLSKTQSSKGTGADSKYSKVQKGTAGHDQNTVQVETVRSSSDRHFSGGAALSEGVAGGNSFGSNSHIMISSSGSRPGSMGHNPFALTSSHHVRRNSLSRVLQQVGGRVFCGSGHMMEELELKGLAPLRREGSGSACNASTVYFEPEELDDEAEMDEAYWQSLAHAILSRRGGRMTGPSPGGYDLSENASILSCTPADRGAVTPVIAEEVEEEEEEDDEEQDSAVSTQVAAEIVPERSSQQSITTHNSVSAPSTSAGIGRSFDSSIYKGKLIRVGGESTRLNTTLDESPCLLHNQHLLQRSVANSTPSPTPSPAPATTSASPQPTRTRSRSSDVLDIGCAPSTSSSSTQTDQNRSTNHSRSNIQPLEKFLWQARLSSSPPREEAEASQMQPPAAPSSGNSTGLRTSLMALLHEEKEESAAEYEQLAVALALEQSTADAEEAGVGRTAAAQQAEQGETGEWCSKLNTLVGEDPLLCCVCMVGRKGAALIPCGHTFCRSCTKQLFTGRGACPLCNNLIVQVLDIF